MNFTPINFKDKFAKFTDYWSPKVISEMNDCQFKLVKVKGEFTWHKHLETDEAFIVMKGDLTIQFRDGEVKLTEGEMFVVQKDIEHKPTAERECEIMIIEPKGIVNTGDTQSKLTAPQEDWI